MKHSYFTQSILLLAICLSSLLANGQLTVPRSSPLVRETHRVGVTDITISYSSPRVNGRTVWGTLVPYQSDIPWRAGANECTTIEFTDDVLINKQLLKKGKYSLLMMPSERGDWTVIFSSNPNLWGGYYYRQSEDALRVQSSPEVAPFREYLSYEFIEKTPSSVSIALEWEKLRIPFKVEIDLVSTTLASFLRELRGPVGNDPNNWVTAVRFCLRNKTNYEEALSWIDRAINGGYAGGFARRDFITLFVKAQVLEQMNRLDESKKFMTEALPLMRTPAEHSNYAEYLLNKKQFAESVKAYQEAVTKHPLYWLYAEYAEALEAAGQLDKAVEASKMAVKLSPPEYRPLNASQLGRLESKLGTKK